jgi:hypothetical protein
VRRLHFVGSGLLALMLLGSGCVKRVTVPEVLAARPQLPTEELIARINGYADIQTFAAQGTIRVRNYFTGVDNKADDLPGGNGLIRLQRPEKIRVQVKAPVINSQVADMVSDGQQFRLAMWEPKKRFLRGTNLKDYERLTADDVKGARDPEVAKAGGLVNMRPQHLTDAFLIKPASVNERIEIFREEVRQEEADKRPGKSKRAVIKSYSVLYVVERNNGRMELRRKFWFDRTQDNQLARQQTFDNGSGRLASDISYSDWAVVPENNRSWPTRVVVDRFNDGYKLELKLEPESMELNLVLPGTTFVLENINKFEEIDLDAPRKSSTAKAIRQSFVQAVPALR